jgi:xanthine/uracil/vitamin C permease (AzgA family)
MKDFFKLKENNTNLATEILAGLTIFFTWLMLYL